MKNIKFTILLLLFSHNAFAEIDTSGYKPGLVVEVYDTGNEEDKTNIHFASFVDSTPSHMDYKEDLSKLPDLKTLLDAKANMTFSASWNGKFLAESEGNYLFLADLSMGINDKGEEYFHNVFQCEVNLYLNGRQLFQLNKKSTFRWEAERCTRNDNGLMKAAREIGRANIYLKEGVYDYTANLVCLRNCPNQNKFYEAVDVQMKVKTPTDNTIHPIPKEQLLYRP